MGWWGGRKAVSRFMTGLVYQFSIYFHLTKKRFEDVVSIDLVVKISRYIFYVQVHSSSTRHSYTALIWTLLPCFHCICFPLPIPSNPPTLHVLARTFILCYVLTLGIGGFKKLNGFFGCWLVAAPVSMCIQSFVATPGY